MEDKFLKFLEESRAELLEKPEVKEFLKKKPEIKKGIDTLVSAFKNHKERVRVKDIKLILDKSTELLYQVVHGLLDQIPSEIRSKMNDLYRIEEESVKWYYSQNEALGGKAPYEVAKTKEGIKEVKNLLGRIEWGIFE